MEKHYVYIIESQTTAKWYYGYTTDLTNRLKFHNNGLNVSTKNRGPWILVFTREFNTKAEATSFEKYLKKTRNKEFIRRAYAEFFKKKHKL